MILFQLIFILAMFAIASLLIGVTLGGVFWIWAIVKRSESPLHIALLGFGFCFKLLPYFILAIFLSVFISVAIRDVDAPIGDSWSFKINDSVALLAIDTPSDWYLSPINGGEQITGSILNIAEDDAFAYGQLKSGNYYIFDKNTSKLTTLTNDKVFDDYLRSSNIVKGDLVEVYDYYIKSRRFGDLVTVIFLMLYPLFKLCSLFLLVMSQLNKPLKRDS